jgi:signal transduction histidine kinase
MLVPVAVITRLVLVSFPRYSFPALGEILVVALIASTWGAGPGVFAAVVGLVLVVTVDLPVHGGGIQVTAGDLIEWMVFLAVGITISLVVSATERSRRRAVSERLEAQAHEIVALRKLQAQMDEFLSVASHELKTPLTGLRGNAQLLTRRLRKVRLDTDDPAAGTRDWRDELRRMVAMEGAAAQRLEHSIDRLGRLVDDLLDDARIHEGRLELRLAPTDLAAIVRAAVDEQQHLVGPRTVHLEMPGDGQPVPVVADAGRIEQVVSNYLTNALKYSQEARPVAVGLSVDGQAARVWVRDAGVGVPPDEQGAIWDRFHRAMGITVQSGSDVGIGIGLHICKTIIERHGGQVGVESAVGQGSTFWFTLPLDPHDEARDNTSATPTS